MNFLSLLFNLWCLMMLYYVVRYLRGGDLFYIGLIFVLLFYFIFKRIRYFDVDEHES
jgi:hypothetical protein